MASRKDKAEVKHGHSKADISKNNLLRYRIRIRGIVQGVGFRPFVYRKALEHNLAGWVLNDTEGVLLEAQGGESDLKTFLAILENEAPPVSRIKSIEVKSTTPRKDMQFHIIKSKSSIRKEPVIPPDIATCDKCIEEIFDSQDRRFGYPFTNCTDCGPRYTIIEDTPYDRPLTSMSVFEMCKKCKEEYERPADRRFHAQPNACGECGPSLFLTDSEGKKLEIVSPLEETVGLLRDGLIVAIKGLGGYHLACDAFNEEAIETLRKRKKRPYKPLAVMSPSLDEVERYAEVSQLERKLLDSLQSPIVLLRKKSENIIPETIAPNISDIGVMLPYTPLHNLLLRNNFTALVMTSGNLADEPTIADNDKALEKLGGVADYFLMHDRDILIQNDDSIVKVMGGEPVILRRARGFVPVSLRLPCGRENGPEILAVGAEEKGAVCFARGKAAFMGQHLGDLKNEESVISFERTLQHTQKLLKIKPEIIACDLHPSYSSTRYALKENVEIFRVQHHWAHIASCMAENGVSGKVIGVSFDGVGFGDDGTSWGGEIFIADLRGYERVGHLRLLGLPGGDAAAGEPYRTACWCLHDAFGAEAMNMAMELLDGVDKNAVTMIFRMIENDVNLVASSSMGRFFDAAASLAGICQVNTYEGQAPMEMESLIGEPKLSEDSYECEIEEEDEMIEIDTRPVIRSIVRDRKNGEKVTTIAAKFHNAISDCVLDVSRKLRSRTGLESVVVSGGVFQNKYLTERTMEILGKDGFRVLRQKKVPPNDGGICFGQVAIAACRYKG